MTGPAEVFTGHPAGPIYLEAAMPRETCSIHVSPRDMNELMNALSYIPFRTDPIRSAGAADPQQTLWGFPLIVSNAAFRPHMAMRWGDTVHYHQLTVQEVMDPGYLERVAQQLDDSARDTVRSAEYERAHRRQLNYEEELRMASEQFVRQEMLRRTMMEYPTHLNANFKNPLDNLKPVTNRRSAIRSIIIEKET